MLVLGILKHYRSFFSRKKYLKHSVETGVLDKDCKQVRAIYPCKGIAHDKTSENHQELNETVVKLTNRIESLIGDAEEEKERKADRRSRSKGRN